MTCSSTHGTAADRIMPATGLRSAPRRRPRPSRPRGCRRRDLARSRLAHRVMELDSYATPAAESLLRSGQHRHAARGHARRVLTTEVVSAALFLVGAGLLAVLGHSDALALARGPRPQRRWRICVAARVQLPGRQRLDRARRSSCSCRCCSSCPRPLVPLIVAACSVLDLWPEAIRGRLSATQVAARIGDSFYSLGPALVLVLAGQQDLLLDRLARAAAGVRGAGAVRRRHRHGADLVRGAGQAHRAAADGVAVRDRRLLLVCRRRRRGRRPSPIAS